MGWGISTLTGLVMGGPIIHGKTVGKVGIEVLWGGIVRSGGVLGKLSELGVRGIHNELGMMLS